MLMAVLADTVELFSALLVGEKCDKNGHPFAILKRHIDWMQVMWRHLFKVLVKLVVDAIGKDDCAQLVARCGRQLPKDRTC